MVMRGNQVADGDEHGDGHGEEDSSPSPRPESTVHSPDWGSFAAVTVFDTPWYPWIHLDTLEYSARPRPDVTDSSRLTLSHPRTLAPLALPCYQSENEQMRK